MSHRLADGIFLFVVEAKLKRSPGAQPSAFGVTFKEEAHRYFEDHAQLKYHRGADPALSRFYLAVFLERDTGTVGNMVFRPPKKPPPCTQALGDMFVHLSKL